MEEQGSGDPKSPKPPGHDFDGGGWLILNRKAGDSIMIGSKIQVVVKSARGKYVQIAIRAPGLSIISIKEKAKKE